jgi:hypothetical protein
MEPNLVRTAHVLVFMCAFPFRALDLDVALAGTYARTGGAAAVALHTP